MGALIESIVALSSRHHLFRSGGLRLADRAAEACLARAGRSAEDVDLLLNAGVYHDENLGEPAVAALVQSDIGANPRISPGVGHGTFSFDVANGAVGVVTGFYVLDGFLSSSIELGLLVASDAHPGTPVSPAFPFPPVGAAALLVPGHDDARGFVAFQFATFPEFEDAFTAHIEWQNAKRGRGRNVLEIVEHPQFCDRLVDTAVATCREFLRSHELSPQALDLVVPSQYPAGFASALGRRLELPAERIARADDELAGAHTAGPLAAFARAEQEGRLADAKSVLFVTAGAGVNIGLALYRP